MNRKATIIASIIDIASQNIMCNILNVVNHINKNDNKSKVITIKDEIIISIYEMSEFRIVKINDENVYQDLIDKKLSQMGYPPSYIIFLSRHSSKSKIKALTVHSTGNYGNIHYGGNDYNELSIPYPFLMSSILKKLNILNRMFRLNCDVTLEITHHGPTKIEVPLFFVEIGSTVNEWNNLHLGKFVAISILFSINEIKKLDGNISNVVVGFGGNHYAANQTKLTINEDINFGHIFPKYEIQNLTENIIKEAFIKSKTNLAYIDKKSIRSNIRNELIHKILSMGYNILER